MFRLLLRNITRFRLNFMMGEEVRNIQRKIHGFDYVEVKDYHEPCKNEFIEPMLFTHDECFIKVTNKGLTLYYAKSSMIKGNLIKEKEKDKLIVFKWDESSGSISQ